jgi:hypothetical protein
MMILAMAAPGPQSLSSSATVRPAPVAEGVVARPRALGPRSLGLRSAL